MCCSKIPYSRPKVIVDFHDVEDGAEMLVDQGMEFPWLDLEEGMDDFQDAGNDEEILVDVVGDMDAGVGALEVFPWLELGNEPNEEEEEDEHEEEDEDEPRFPDSASKE
mmetsp:Transcript_23406/g.54372  ORF Transcript_23406/g.54372 Transcript_23406/m.54372 type:complete len:109 (-) Transcript_23406:272-598(-)|eukprot:CAMPEP_0116823678 /NCGR_PEP_ID=MMETSP0418-20121206/972_1 /TAXON_ID=1158023 /ORGANISM="Astrosyne radiata, Strain 13vi08-1A" /LENGTH=108 /DNA_ID=CAMNT_0004451959 /DNA_START=650 /DNA_END=976 /DNA_ORIENTATION=+